MSEETSLDSTEHRNDDNRAHGASLSTLFLATLKRLRNRISAARNTVTCISFRKLTVIFLQTHDSSLPYACSSPNPLTGNGNSFPTYQNSPRRGKRADLPSEKKRPRTESNHLGKSKTGQLSGSIKSLAKFPEIDWFNVSSPLYMERKSNELIGFPQEYQGHHFGRPPNRTQRAS